MHYLIDLEVTMSDLKDMHSEQTHMRSRHKRRRTQTVTLGAGILLLAAIGVCVIVFFIVKSAAGYVKDFVGPNETASYFNSYLAPVVMFDTDTFNDISGAKAQWKLETAIWAALDENEKNGSYASTSDGREILPVKDVASYMKKYFGGTVKPSYMTFSDGNFTYEFNKKEQCYYIPLIAVTDYYIPSVTKISRSFNTVTLTVGYIPGKNWGQDSSGNVTQPAPDKTMKIILTGSRGSYVIKAIKNAEQVVSSSQSLNSSSKISTSESGGTSSAVSSSQSGK